MTSKLFFMNDLKKHIKRIAACGLITALVLTSPIGVKSSEVVSATKNEYLKEVVLSYGKTESDAKKWLTDNGYKVVDGDLNKGTDATGKTVNVVLMGYKTTTNSAEAIRDISLMEMTGGFKTTDINSIIESQSNAIDDSLEQLITLAGEYKVKYKAAVKAKAKGKTNNIVAITTHDILNKFKEDDSKKGMGDYLLKDFTNEDNKEALRNVLIQSNPQTIAVLENYISMATGDKSENWVDKMARLSKNKTFFERQKAIFKTNKRTKAYIDETYGDYVDSLTDSWKTMQDRLKEAVETTEELSEIKENEDKATDEILNEYFEVDTDINTNLDELEGDELVEAHEKVLEKSENVNEEQKYLEAISISEYLSRLNYGDGDLYDFFTKERDFSDGLDRYEVCAVLEALSDGQKLVLGEAIDIYNLIKTSMTNDKETYENKDAKAALKSTNKEIDLVEETSIYAGINRKIFDGDVAITSLADTRTANNIVYPSKAALAFSSIGIVAGLAVTGLGVLFVYQGIREYMGKIISYEVNGFLDTLTYKTTKKICNSLFDERYLGVASKTYFEDEAHKATREKAERLLTKYNRVAGSIILGIGVAIAVIGIIISAYNIWKIVDEAKAKLKGDYSVDIPEFMVDTITDPNEVEDNFIYYEAVKCNRNDQNMKGVKMDYEGLKDFGDINGDSGKYWVTMYTTTDVSAGKPIDPSSFEVKYGDTPYEEGYTQIHSFNTRSTGLNLTSPTFNFADKENGTYVRYKTMGDSDDSDDSDNSVNTASAFSSGKGVMVVLGALFGALISTMVVYLGMRRKKEQQ
ncbi:MAG: hypothetical protein K6D02_07335 [Lachnospiraceae bacterium]|nr:hypothetical protein [Lachnospiraceae bacterium]